MVDARGFGRLLALAAAIALGQGCSGDDTAATPGGDGPNGDGSGSGAGIGDDSASQTAGGDGSAGVGSSGDGTAGVGSSAGGSGSGSGGGSGSVANLPSFPGAGSSAEAQPLQGGMLCDSVAGDGEVLIAPPPAATCFSDKNDPGAMTAATLEQVLECVEETDVLHVRLTFHPWFVDNTYGSGSIGWPERRGHTMRDLDKSDHAEIIIRDGDGEIVLQFKLDYISPDDSAPSGYSSLGVEGGDGSVIVGDASAIVDWNTSLNRNLNERGYEDYTTDSPATDEDYTANPETPEWDYRVVYEAWIDLSIFGDSGFEGASIEYVHASPSKSSSDTIEVDPGECPPPGDECADSPDADCGQDEPPGDGGGDPCFDGDPDTFCGGGGVGGVGGSGSGSGGTGGSGSGSGGTGGNGGDPLDPCFDGDPDTFCGGGGTGGVGGSGSGGTGGSGSGSGGTGGNGGDPLDPCTDNDPDTFCWPEEPGDNGGDPQYCDDHPEDPLCNVD
ncbi:MAG: hypothetical protein PVI30_10575 [Myxococcales bacterium]|jgi:hypothetical protein